MNEDKELDLNNLELDGDAIREYTLIPEGDYPFEIAKWSRKKTEARGKLPACTRVYRTFNIINDDGENIGTVEDDIPALDSMKWKFKKLFGAIGQWHEGEALRPNWDELIGSTGLCSIKIREWKTKEGETRQSNRIDLKVPQKEETPSEW